jgi:hypothetical protein
VVDLQAHGRDRGQLVHQPFERRPFKRPRTHVAYCFAPAPSPPAASRMANAKRVVKNEFLGL